MADSFSERMQEARDRIHRQRETPRRIGSAPCRRSEADRAWDECARLQALLDAARRDLAERDGELDPEPRSDPLEFPPRHDSATCPGHCGDRSCAAKRAWRTMRARAA